MTKKRTPIQEILLELHKIENFRIKWTFDYTHIQQLFNEPDFYLVLSRNPNRIIVINKTQGSIRVTFKEKNTDEEIKIMYNRYKNELSYTATRKFKDSIIEKVVQRQMYLNMPPRLILLTEKEEIAQFEKREYGYLCVEKQHFLSFKDVENLYDLAISKIENENTLVLNIPKEVL